jgi:hypothetical protein
LRPVIAADTAAALMARLLGLRLLALHRTIARIMALAWSFALMVVLLTLLRLVALLVFHEGHLLLLLHRTHRDAGDAPA